MPQQTSQIISKKEEKPDVSVVDISKVPKNLFTDADLSKLVFPKQDFMREVGKEGLPTPPSLETHSPPDFYVDSNSFKPGTSENEDFKTNPIPRSTEKDLDPTLTDSILLKKRDQIVNLTPPDRIEKTERLFSKVSSFMERAESIVGNEITNTLFNTRLNNFEFTEGSNNHLISDRYSLIQKQSSNIENIYQNKISMLEKENVDLQNSLSENISFDELSERKKENFNKFDRSSIDSQ